jgi:hypothetical protein
MEFNGLEQLNIESAKDYEKKAAELRRRAEESRQRRIDAAEAERKRVTEAQSASKEDFDDRVRLLLSKFTRELKSLDLKIGNNFGMGGSKMVLHDAKETRIITTVEVTGQGFQWH